MASAERIIKDLLKEANVKVGGKRPQDLVVHDKRFYRRALRDQVLGVGESYMDGWWDAKHLDVLMSRIIAADLGSKVKASPKILLAGASAKLLNKQNLKRAAKNAQHHYGMGNDLYEVMLDKRMIYSCGYWKGTRSLDKAQEQKLDLICRKLELDKGMKVLDIGCGWGGFLEYAAKKYGIRGVGVTPVGEQVEVAKKRVKNLNVKIIQDDYRNVTGKYDRIVSIGSFEHIGHKNHKKFFEVCDRLLKPGGMMLHHFIGGNTDSFKPDPWINKYIFPNGSIPSLKQVSKAIEGKFLIEDLHNFGPDYDKTLMAWHKNFSKGYKKLNQNYDERFYRMWSFYLLMCAAGFRQRDLQLWQFVMRRIEPAETYRGVR
ncbi:MAG TPA: cyclopropane fatty acyl phospholipid synthase [Candidatus Saccharibacteria bacterium]|nr:cyclopropane fatty acyl phospholipid synthase [Candidatus Saccharibacteria bacterium]HRK93861.1 cyclopropane fatty acyl phospholipid synthase [Candidatus Saccharibacteria bacterium]